MKSALKKWADYVLDPSKCDGVSIDDYNPLLNHIYYSSDNAFLEEDNECFAWSYGGDINVKEDINKREISKEGTIWKLMISFPPEFALNNGLVSKQDFYELTKNIIPTLFADSNLKLENTVWYAGLHRNTKNPHMHLCFYQEKNINKNKHIPSHAIYKLKSNIANYLINNVDFYTKRDYEFKNIMGTISFEDFTKIKSLKFFDNSFRKRLNKMLNDLYLELPKKGRLQYNSKNMKPYKSDLDEIIRFILSHDSVKYQFAEYEMLLQKHQKRLIEMYGETKNNKNNKYYNEQIAKLYTQIGNDILHSFKVYQSKDFTEKEKVFLEKNITKLKFKSRNDYAKETSRLDCARDLYKLCKFAGKNDSQIIKIMNDWIYRSKYNYNAHKLLEAFKNINYDMSTTDYFKALSRLGYNYERYSKIKNKNFYKELNYKRIFNNALKYTVNELEKEEKELEEELRYELEIKNY